MNNEQLLKECDFHKKPKRFQVRISEELDKKFQEKLRSEGIRPEIYGVRAKALRLLIENYVNS